MDLPTLTNLCLALGCESRAKLYFTILESPEPLHHGVVASICEMSKTTASHHLRILTNSGLLERVETGKYTLFLANKRKLFELVHFFNTLLEEKQYEAIRSSFPSPTEDSTLRTCGHVEDNTGNQLGKSE